MLKVISIGGSEKSLNFDPWWLVKIKVSFETHLHTFGTRWQELVQKKKNYTRGD